jgi:hypothetical protein
MITMYEMIMTNALDANACLTPRSVTLTSVSYVFYYSTGDITRERHQQRMLSFVTEFYLSYRQEVDYKGFNEVIRVTLVSYH